MLSIALIAVANWEAEIIAALPPGAYLAAIDGQLVRDENTAPLGLEG